jgi:hypothetical protein
MFDALRVALREFVRGLRGDDTPPHLELEPLWGFIVRRAGEFVRAVQWDEVREIAAYRYAGPSRDIIALVFFLKGDLAKIEINEESPGWEELVAAMIESFPSIPSDWSETVAAPPPPGGDPQRKVLFKGA